MESVNKNPVLTLVTHCRVLAWKNKTSSCVVKPWKTSVMTHIMHITADMFHLFFFAPLLISQSPHSHITTYCSATQFIPYVFSIIVLGRLIWISCSRKKGTHLLPSTTQISYTWPRTLTFPHLFPHKYAPILLNPYTIPTNCKPPPLHLCPIRSPLHIFPSHHATSFSPTLLDTSFPLRPVPLFCVLVSFPLFRNVDSTSLYLIPF